MATAVPKVFYTLITIASATELLATPVTEQNEIVYANDLTIYGYVQKGTVNGLKQETTNQYMLEFLMVIGLKLHIQK